MSLQIGRYAIAAAFLFFVSTLGAQKIYYPSHSSDLLKSTAQDIADLFNRSISGSHFNIEEYNAEMPQSGIILFYDSSVLNNETCKIESDGNSVLKFSASQDNGLCFGIYSYLQKLGFRFYLPGTLWEKIPSLTSPYTNTHTIVSETFKYNSWFISGGHNRWAMDNDDSYSWDMYFGSNGHEWAKYQRRNNMLGGYRFNGHRGDILNADYLTTLQRNPCYVACYNGARTPGLQSVPDINNNESKQLWANTIQERYSSYKNIIASNPNLYANYYRNFNYYNQYIGIEVSDGSKWGNSSDNSACSTGNYNGNPYPKESDQQFILANYTAQKINSVLPGIRFQCYAYAGHAQAPSSTIIINNNIDVQVIASAFQFETSTKGLLNRWYQRNTHVSEYHYVNIPQWTGETPMFSLNEYKNTLQRLKLKNSDGIVVEASPSKFASLPFLFAGNRFLSDNTIVDTSINEFVFAMFPGEVGTHVKQLLQMWGDENVATVGNFINDNKYKLPVYLQELSKAVIASSQITDTNVVARLREIKAYLHYMKLYFDFITDPAPYKIKSTKAIELCLYLAKINKLQLVNSYFLIQNIVNKYDIEDDINIKYNTANGTAYLNGNLSLITDAEIDNNFINDLSQYDFIANYKFENATTIISKMKQASLKPLEKINVKIGYTNGIDYSNRSEFYFYAPSKGSVTINYIAHFAMPDKGVINFTAEADDNPLLIIKDETISANNNPGIIQIDVPSAGIYKLSIVSKFQTSVDISITTNGNTFFKKGAFYGDKVENYREDWNSLPRYFYVPENIDAVFFSVNNACPYNNSCVTSPQIQNAFSIKDNNEHTADLQSVSGDPSIYKISIESHGGAFWQVTRMREYNLSFANISNIEIYAEKEICIDCGTSTSLSSTDDVVPYPNPSTGVYHFTTSSKETVASIQVYNVQGKLVSRFSNTEGINISSLPAGIYLYSAEKGSKIYKGKLIKE